MRLLVVSHLYSPDICGGASIFTDLCHGLAELEVDVTVRCSYPHFPEWTDKSGCNGLAVARSRVNGINIERYGMFIPKDAKSMGQRLLCEATYMLSLSRKLFSRDKFDAVLVFCPMMGSVVFGSLYKLLHRVPTLLDVEDLPADAAAAGGMISGHGVKAFLCRIQKSLFNQYDTLRTISPVMADRLRHITDRPVIHIPHWVHPNLSLPLGALPSKFGRVPGNPIKLLYAGNLGTKQGLLGVCQELHRTDLQFVFDIKVNGGCAAELTAWVHNCGDPRFRVGPVVCEPEFVAALYDADYFVITEKADRGASFFPSKLVPGMASRTPILTVSTADSPLGTEVLAHGLGPWFDWSATATIANVLRNVQSCDFTRWQSNAGKRAEFYDRNAQIHRYLEALRAMTKDIA